MNHLTADQITAAYYGELDSSHHLHLEQCAECRAEFDRLKHWLNELREQPVPEREPFWERELWDRLDLPPIRAAKKPWFHQWWIAVPAIAAVALIAFFAGMVTQRQQAPAVARVSGERVLLIAIGDHLDRSQMVLAELAHAPDAGADLEEERARARDLLTDNRLLRQTAVRAGEAASAGLLDELERVLLDIANSPPDSTASDLEEIQRRIADEGLLLKVRIVSTNVRQKGLKL